MTKTHTKKIKMTNFKVKMKKENIGTDSKSIIVASQNNNKININCWTSLKLPM